MSVNNAEDEYSSSRGLEEIESPRKRMRMDTSSRKSWSLMDRKTDHEVLQEMGVSLLESDDGDPHNDHCHHRPLKRKHNIENVNPNANSSPAPSHSPSPRKPGSPARAPAARRPSRHSSEKSRPVAPLETSLEGGAGSHGAADEETPLAQSVLHVAPLALQQRRHNTPPAGAEGAGARAGGAGGARWQPSGPDAFAALSDEVMLSVCRWLPKRTLAHCMLLSRRWHRIACDETLWQRLDLGHKALCAGALPRVLRREPVALRLAGAEIGAWGAGEAEEAGEGAARVQYLDLSMAAVDVATLNQLLRRCPALRKLSLEGLQLDDRTCDIIGACAELETLNLTMSRGVTGEGLARVLRGARRLAALNVAWSCLAPPALQELCSRAGGSRLQRLNLAGARALTDDMVAELVRSWPALVELDLSDCPRLTAACLPALCTLPRLEHLALSRCYLLPAGALASLRASPRLQYVEAWGMLSAPALAALRAALPHLQLNQYMFSAIARPTVGTRRTSIWGLRTRD